MVRRHLYMPTLIAVTLAVSGCGGSSPHVSNSQAARDCLSVQAHTASLVGMGEGSIFRIATVKDFYPSIRGLDRFLSSDSSSVGSYGSVVVCVFSDGSSFHCKGSAEILVVPDGRLQFTRPCNAPSIEPPQPTQAP